MSLYRKLIGNLGVIYIIKHKKLILVVTANLMLVSVTFSSSLLQPNILSATPDQRQPLSSFSKPNDARINGSQHLSEMAASNMNHNATNRPFVLPMSSVPLNNSNRNKDSLSLLSTRGPSNTTNTSNYAVGSSSAAPLTHHGSSTSSSGYHHKDHKGTHRIDNSHDLAREIINVVKQKFNPGDIPFP